MATFDVSLTPDVSSEDKKTISSGPNDFHKRIILRLRVKEFDTDGRTWNDHVDAISTYLTWVGRQPSEYSCYYEKSKHYAHVEPFQDEELNQKTFHVILDIDYQSLEKPDFDEIPHEVYRVRRNAQGDLEVKPFKNPLEAKIIIQKTRHYTDMLYPWGSQKQIKEKLHIVSYFPPARGKHANNVLDEIAMQLAKFA